MNGKRIFALSVAGAILLSCGADSVTSPETTAVVPQVVWKSATGQPVPEGVDSIRLSVESPSLATALVKTFAYKTGRGTIPDVPTGISITIRIEGIDFTGEVLYEGMVTVARVTGTTLEVSIEARQVTPPPPGDLEAQVVSSNSILLEWTDNSPNESYFVVTRRNAATQVFDSIGATQQSSFTDSNLVPATLYTYRIYAVNAAGTSKLTEVSSAETAPIDSTGPTILVLSHQKVDTVSTLSITLYGTTQDSNGIDRFLVDVVEVQPDGIQWRYEDYHLSGAVDTIVIKAFDNSFLHNETAETLFIYYDTTYVDTVNNPPAFTVPVGSLEATVRVGDPYRKVLSASDPDGGDDTLRFTVSSELNLAGKDTVLWTPAESDIGTNRFYALVFDTSDAKDSISWVVTVRDSAADMNLMPDEVIIPSGTFSMGASNISALEQPVHDAVLQDSFYMDATEMINAAYREYDPLHSSVDTGSSHPVTYVSWYDCIAFCNWRSKRSKLDTVYSWAYDSLYENGTKVLFDLVIDYSKNGYRLPTEVEWERAAKGGKNYDYGTSTGTLGASLASYTSNNTGTTKPVASFPANPYGLYDMCGSVYEWTNNFSYTYPATLETNFEQNGTSAADGVIVRGGGWYSSSSLLRTQRRNPQGPIPRQNVIGFRCVRNLR